MSNKSYRNPHLFPSLVEFVGVDETTTCYPKEIWNPAVVRVDWYADRIGA